MLINRGEKGKYLSCGRYVLDRIWGKPVAKLQSQGCLRYILDGIWECFIFSTLQCIGLTLLALKRVCGY